MSFYSGRKQGICPGTINGSPINGLCERVCIQTNKVFDACMKQITESNMQLTATTFNPASPSDPLTFVSAKCVAENVELTNLVVDRFEDKPCFARVTGDIQIPVEISYTDSNGTPGTTTVTMTVSEDVVLYVPQPSIVPYKIEAFANCVVPDGRYVGDNVFSIDCCLTIILRVLVNVELLVPSYGYCPIPPCQEYTQDVCSGFFELPLYPSTTN